MVAAGRSVMHLFRSELPSRTLPRPGVLGEAPDAGSLFTAVLSASCSG